MRGGTNGRNARKKIMHVNLIKLSYENMKTMKTKVEYYLTASLLLKLLTTAVLVMVLEGVGGWE